MTLPRFVALFLSVVGLGQGYCRRVLLLLPSTILYIHILKSFDFFELGLKLRVDSA